MLLINTAVFGLYIASVIVYYTFRAIAYSPNGTAKQMNNMFISWMASAVCSAIAQLCLCGICWSLSVAPIQSRQTTMRSTGSKSEKESLAEPLATEEFDEDGEVQARIWN